MQQISTFDFTTLMQQSLSFLNQKLQAPLLWLYSQDCVRPGWKPQRQIFTQHDSIIIWASSWENLLFAYAKTKTQISFAVTAKLISAFVFATWIVQSLYFLNMKFQASSYLVWLYSLVCVGPGQKPRRPVFSERGSFSLGLCFNTNNSSILAHQKNISRRNKVRIWW